MNALICTEPKTKCHNSSRCCHDCTDKHDCTQLKCVSIPKTCAYCVDPTAKDVKGKPRLGLVSPALIEAVGAIRTYGTEKYGDKDNWLSVPAEYYLDAALRHLCAYMRDPAAVDDESGYPHIWHVACNVSFLVEMGGSAVDDTN